MIHLSKFHELKSVHMIRTAWVCASFRSGFLIKVNLDTVSCDDDGDVDDGGFLTKVNLVIVSCDDDGDPAECEDGDNGWWKSTIIISQTDDTE